jgi:hypothetical protein
VSMTSAISSGPIAGGLNARKVWRMAAPPPL